jgi:hypothetical protein
MSVGFRPKKWPHHSLSLIAVVCALTGGGCSLLKGKSGQAHSPNHPSQENAVRATSSISASPNPARVCDPSTVGVTTLTWTSETATSLEVHVSSPAGALFSRSGPTGSATTGEWVKDGMIFFLQDTSNNQPSTPFTTLASVTVKTTSEGCPPRDKRAREARN